MRTQSHAVPNGAAAPDFEGTESGDPPEPFRLTVLESIQDPLNKRVPVSPAGEWGKPKSYGNAYLFRRHLSESITDIYGLAETLRRIERNPQLCLVTGRPCGSIPLGQPARRLKHAQGSDPATLEDQASRFLPADVDKLEIPGADVIGDPEGAVDAILELLGPEFEDVSCYYQFTSSQKPDGEILSLRLYFVVDAPHTGAEYTRWAKSLKAKGIPVDPNIYTGANPIYTTPPTFHSETPPFQEYRDPLPRRSGFLERGQDVVALVIPEDEPRYTATGETITGLGFNARLELIGDHPGGAGIHTAIRDAIAAYVSKYGSAIDREEVKAIIRQRVAEADKSNHPDLRYIEEQVSDRTLDTSIEGAIRKFSAEADEWLRQAQEELPAYVTPADEAEALTPEAAQGRLRGIISDLKANPLDGQGRQRRVAVRASTGFGKSTIAVEATREQSLIWFAPTTRQAAETAARYGDRARQILGRLAIDPEGNGEETMCWRPLEVQALQDKGKAQSTKRLLCHNDELPPPLNTCPYFGRCGYMRQILDPDPPPVTVCAHEYLALDKAEVMALARETSTIGVIDEDSTPSRNRSASWPVDDLIAEGGVLARIVARIVQGSSMREILKDLDIEAAVAELEACMDDLPSPRDDIPDIYPGAPASDNLTALSRYEPEPRAKLWPAYLAVLGAVRDGKVNSVWHVSGNGDRPHRVHAAWLDPPATVTGLPLLILDATADPEITKAAWGDNVEFHSWGIEPRGVEIVQITDQTFYKRKLEDPESGLQDRLGALVRATDSALITHKGALEQMREASKIPADTLTANFKALRGLDYMKDCQSLIVAGRIEPPVYVVEDMARALWPDRDLDLGHTDYIKAVTHYRLRDGTTQPVIIRAHPDPLVNRVLVQVRDAELVQAVGRLRAIWGEAGRRLFVLTSVPVPGLVVDHLVTLDDLVPDTRACRGLLATNGALPLPPAELVQILPAEFVTTTAAKEWARRLKVSFSGKELLPGNDTFISHPTHRLEGHLKGTLSGKSYLPGSVPFIQVASYRLEGQAGQLAKALTWHADKDQARTALEAVLGRTVKQLELAIEQAPIPKPDHQDDPDPFADAPPLSPPNVPGVPGDYLSRPSRYHLPPAIPVPELLNDLAEHRARLAKMDLDAYHERAAILEHDAGLSRVEADRRASTVEKKAEAHRIWKATVDSNSMTVICQEPTTLADMQKDLYNRFGRERVKAITPHIPAALPAMAQAEMV